MLIATFFKKELIFSIVRFYSKSHHKLKIVPKATDEASSKTCEIYFAVTKRLVGISTTSYQCSGFPFTKSNSEKVNESKLNKMGQNMPLSITKWNFLWKRQQVDMF